MNTTDASSRRPRGRDIGVVLWSAFLAACLASLLFFAVVDPAELRGIGPRLFDDLDREAGYALGFALFWLTGAVAGALSVFLIRTSNDEPPQ